MSIFQRIDASGTSSYLTDALGSTLALADASGGLATSYVYDPFGNTTVTGSSSNPYQFTGREDEGTGLYFYRARYYSPSFQRFIAQDPIDFAGGTVNLYEYAENNPLAFADPFGKQVYPYPPGVPPPKIPRGPVLQPYPPGEPGYQCDRGEPPPRSYRLSSTRTKLGM